LKLSPSSSSSGKKKKMLTLCVLLSIRVPISYITDGNKIKEMFGFIFLIFIRPFFRFLVVNFFSAGAAGGLLTFPISHRLTTTSSMSHQKS
jgi:hypothetical protein